MCYINIIFLNPLLLYAIFRFQDAEKLCNRPPFSLTPPPMSLTLFLMRPFFEFNGFMEHWNKQFLLCLVTIERGVPYNRWLNNDYGTPCMPYIHIFRLFFSCSTFSWRSPCWPQPSPSPFSVSTGWTTIRARSAVKTREI